MTTPERIAQLLRIERADWHTDTMPKESRDVADAIIDALAERIADVYADSDLAFDRPRFIREATRPL